MVYGTDSLRLPPVLLTTPMAGGTLAAARELGSRGIPVTIAGDELLAAARWSRFASGFARCPSMRESDRFVEWLVTFGQENPGHVLLPTSDETVWLFAANAALLEPHFRMYQPPLQSALSALDKKTFWHACERAGVDTVPSWFPADDDELRSLAPTLPYPILIKPRTHVHRILRDKGVVVYGADELLSTYRTIEQRERYLPGSGATLAHANRPFLQKFVQRTNEPVYSVCGFIDRNREIMVARGSAKVLQRWRTAGIGVCFEARSIEPALHEAVERLCCEIGHFGIFEVEFLSSAGKWAAIDFNPRFYHQMGMDIGRGLPLPFLAYLGACEEKTALKDEMARAALATDVPTSVFRDRFTFWALLTAMSLTGRLSPEERTHWSQWEKNHRVDALDIALDARDPLPGFVHAVSEITLGLKSAFRFIRASESSQPAAAPASKGLIP